MNSLEKEFWINSIVKVDKSGGGSGQSEYRWCAWRDLCPPPGPSADSLDLVSFLSPQENHLTRHFFMNIKNVKSLEESEKALDLENCKVRNKRLSASAFHENNNNCKTRHTDVAPQRPRKETSTAKNANVGGDDW
ncbi:hypothetical protein DdX_05871 [Ditylenchus destructor]|uniref:Uncharacterized protein n=1 Tax=Ditylenchus destructor TaxID=166010 RepID=A0AAD4R637_9BILA|nr:hypothetical protein DdX_05871 [Ditylenchus destructor]